MPNNPPQKVNGYIDGDKRKGRRVVGSDHTDGLDVYVQGRIKAGVVHVERLLTAHSKRSPEER